MIGRGFYDFIKTYEYDKILRILGRTFTKFLNGLDNLHEYLKFTYPKLKPPSFFCEHASRTGVTLHYRSKRRGFVHYVKGQIKAIAQTLYDLEVKIELLDHEVEDNMEHIIMRLHFNNMDYMGNKGKTEAEDEIIRNDIKITSDIFFDIFPFIIVFNRGLRIRNIGLGLLRVLPRLIGKKISNEFVLMRPLIRFRWQEIMVYSNNIFEIMTVEPIYDDGKIHITNSGDPRGLQEERRRMQEEEKKKFLTLKGPMMYMEEWESICFLGIPVMDSLEQMHNVGLYINDLAIHDSSRDLVLSHTQQEAELKILLEQEGKKNAKLNESMGKLKEERQRTNQLLYQLLPKSVAIRLAKGSTAVETCENFDSVTILFTDVVGFTTICSGIKPIDVVNFLNEMYSSFDNLTEKHGVFKVETIGDAYMVVGGAPNKTQFHAELVLDCAMSIMHNVKDMKEASSQKDIKIRAGVHTGSVVAGVVGLKMPRYCLFGDAVATANRMESSGQPMRIQVSETTHAEAEIMNPGLFQFTDNVTEGKLKTYWLEGKQGPPREPEPELCESRAESSCMGEMVDRFSPDCSVYTPVDDAAVASSRAASAMSSVHRA